MIPLLDSLALAATVAALFLLLTGWKNYQGPDTRRPVLTLLILMGASLTFVWIEWVGLSNALERYEDFIGALVPVFWAFLFYAYIQKGMNSELSESEEKLRVTLNSIGDGMIATDSEGRIIRMNRTAERTTGYAFPEARFRKLSDLVTLTEVSGDRPVKDPVSRVLRSGEAVQLSGFTKMQRQDGAVCYISDSAAPIRDERGSLLGTILIFRDETETFHLHKQVEEAERQARHSQKLEALGQLAGGIAHDLNNLLTPILGYSEMLNEDDGLNARQKKAMETVRRAGERARDLVRRLLAFSRRQTLDVRPVDLNTVLEHFEKLLIRAIPADVHIRRLCAEHLPPVRADVGQLEQVIMNLAVNAADAMPEGGELLFETGVAELDERYCGLHADAIPGRYVMLSVSDTGCGMDAETREHIYDPFFSTKGERGTGLGLATVFGIVKQHGGNIYLYSEPGKGSTFKIYLPVATGGVVAAHAAEPLPFEELTGTETILLVDDNDLVRQLGQSILEPLGYTVLPSESGEDALQLLQQYDGPVDLLLTDIVMPGINGRRLYEEAVCMRPALKVVYMSGYSENIISCRGVLNEDVHYLQKPFSARQLAAGIREALSGFQERGVRARSAARPV